MAGASPYPWLAERRARSAVAPEPGPDGDWFGVYSWEAVHAVLTSRRVSSGPYFERLELSDRFGPTMIGVDGEPHRRLRSLVEPAFTREAIELLRPRVLQPAIDASISGIVDTGHADLVATVCSDVPVRVLAGVLGLEPDVVMLLRPLAEVVTADDLEQAARAADDAFDLLVPHLAAARRAAASGDRGLLGTLLAPSGPQLSDRDAFALVRLLIIAGIDTLGRSASSFLLALLSDPSHLAMLRARPGIADAAADESIRWECPAVSVPRRVVHDVEVSGMTLPAGSLLHCYLAGANHDPTRWQRPDDFDPLRSRRPHAGFGLGPHRCLGMHLARATLAELAHALAQRLPGLRLSTAAPAPRVSGTDVRAPAALHVTWDLG